MASILWKNNNFQLDQKKIHNVMLWGLLIRLALLIFMITIGTQWIEPYFISDDIAYERKAYRFMLYANGPFDFDYLDELISGYLQSFWPSVMCISAAIFHSYYAGRFINVVLSTLCVKVIYNLTYILCQKKNTAMLAGKLFAYFPINILLSCFPIKDIFLTTGVLYIFYIFLLMQNRYALHIGQIILAIITAVCVYFTRGAVIEMMSIFLVVFLLDGCIRQKRYNAAFFVVMATIAMWLVYGDRIMAAFMTKIDDYSDYNTRANGLAMLQMQNPGQFYKLPFAYFFATLQPMKLNLMETGQTWLGIISLMNISMYPIAIGNFMYIFQKKHNFVFWLCGLIIYCAVISMSLGIFRHYMFLLPLIFINFSLYAEGNTKNRNTILVGGSIAILGVVLLYTFIKL